MLKNIWNFIRAVARHWGALMTGGFLIGLLFIYQGTGHTVLPSVYWGIALVALFVAFYRAWAEERSAKEEALHRVSGDQRKPSREYWLELYKEKQRLEEELESTEFLNPPDVKGSLPIARWMTDLEMYESMKRHRKVTRLKKELKLIEDQLRLADPR